VSGGLANTRDYHNTRLPHEWHKTMPDAFLVINIAWQMSGEKVFLVEESPYQKWHHRGDRDKRQ
jgi:hypothetical protein